MLSRSHGKINIFGFLGVWHINRGRTKYCIYNCPIFIWHLDCNERCRINNVIPHFVAPKLSAKTALFMGQNQSYLDEAEPPQLIWENSFGLSSLFLFFGSKVNANMLAPKGTLAFPRCTTPTNRPQCFIFVISSSFLTSKIFCWGESWSSDFNSRLQFSAIDSCFALEVSTYIFL